MSFTVEVKKELIAVSYSTTCCRRAHLAGLCGFCGAMVQENGKESLKMRTESREIAERIGNLFSELFGFSPLIDKAGKIYNVVCEEHIETVLSSLGFWQQGRVKFCVDPFVTHDDCCKTAFLAGAFLGGGYVKTPKNGYHLEIKTHYRDLSYELSALISEMDFEPKAVMRKAEYVIYFKQSDIICDILAQMGATDAMLELLNVKIYKDMCNNVTRKVNCDTANIAKSANAAAIQLSAIRKIQEKRGLDAMSKPLEEMAYLRLENPEANLTELGNLLCPPISKSGVNHRLKKIVQFAESL